MLFVVSVKIENSGICGVFFLIFKQYLGYVKNVKKKKKKLLNKDVALLSQFTPKPLLVILSAADF